MPSQFDPRDTPEVRDLLQPFADEPHSPFVHAADMRETRLVLDALPALEFPITSAGELVDKLTSSGGPLRIAGVEVDPAAIVNRMPAQYFPIMSRANFAEKVAELIRRNRKKVNVTEELANIKAQLPALQYPISNRGHLVNQLGRDKEYRYQGREIRPGRIASRIPNEIFPISSQEDFDRKISGLMVSQPLIVED